MKEYLRGRSRWLPLRNQRGLFGAGEELENQPHPLSRRPRFRAVLTATGSGDLSYDDGVHGEELWAAILTGHSPGADLNWGTPLTRRFSGPHSWRQCLARRRRVRGGVAGLPGLLDEFSLKMVMTLYRAMGSEPHVLGSLDQFYVFYATTLHGP